MDKKVEAKARLVSLLKTAQRSENSGMERGNLSHADFDEVKFLAEFLGQSIPPQIRDLVKKTGFLSKGNDQVAFGERALRAFSLIEEFGEPQSAKSEHASEELLPLFELEQSDKERIFKLCGGMRKIVFASTVFDEPHKKRLLNRIAAIEQQVHSPKGMFDVILGGVSDIGETLGKFGTDIKPLTDRMKEVEQIARRGTKEYNQIPAPEEAKKLPAPEEVLKDG